MPATRSCPPTNIWTGLVVASLIEGSCILLIVLVTWAARHFNF